MNNEPAATNPAEPTTAYTPWPWRKVQVEVTPDLVKAYFLESTAVMSDLLDQLILIQPYTLSVFLDENRQDFDEFVLSRIGGDY